MIICLKRNSTGIDYAFLSPREISCFYYWIGKILSQIRQPNEEANNANKIYNTNINFNTNILMNTSPQMRNPLQTTLSKSQMINTQRKNVEYPSKDAKILNKISFNEPLDEDDFWGKLINVLDNPFLNDIVLRDTVKAKKIEKRKPDVPIKEMDTIIKKVKKDDFQRNFIIISKAVGGLGPFVEMFKDILGNYDEQFKQSLLGNLEKFRGAGYVVIYSIFYNFS